MTTIDSNGLTGPAPWVLICGGFHQRGGMDKANSALADYLLARGTPLHLVGHDVDGKYRDHPGVTIHAVPHPPGGFALSDLWLGRHGRSVASRLRRLRPDTRVICNGGNCAWPDMNWVHYVHHAWRPPSGGGPWSARFKRAIAGALARRTERRALAVARWVFTNSERTRRDVITLLGCDPARVHNVYLGADPEWGPPSPEERAAARAWLNHPAERPLAVFVGALGNDSRKGFDTLWKAWRDLCTRPDWDVDLVVAGSGKSLAYWQGLTERAGLADRVRLLGFTDQVCDLLAAADLLVSPVRYEAYGLNVQEALCRGVPAIVSASAGVAEQYPPEMADLLLANPEDADELVHKLLHWRSQASEWRKRVLPCSETLRDYTWEKMAARMVALVEHVR